MDQETCPVTALSGLIERSWFNENIGANLHGVVVGDRAAQIGGCFFDTIGFVWKQVQESSANA